MQSQWCGYIPAHDVVVAFDQKAFLCQWGAAGWIRLKPQLFISGSSTSKCNTLQSSTALTCMHQSNQLPHTICHLLSLYLLPLSLAHPLFSLVYQPCLISLSFFLFPFHAVLFHPSFTVCFYFIMFSSLKFSLHNFHGLLSFLPSPANPFISLFAVMFKVKNCISFFNLTNVLLCGCIFFECFIK